MSIQSIAFAGIDIRVAELQNGRYFNKADLLRATGAAPNTEMETQYLDILEATKLIGDQEKVLDAMQIWAPHLCAKPIIDVH